MLQNQHEDDDHHCPNSSLGPILPPCSTQDFHGVASLLGKRSMSFSGIDMCHNQENININGEDDLSDDGSQIGEKKRRLTMEQVKTLEKSFELGNKLEPERKMQLAKSLGLQPRQIAIWFQNRRARWKTKQLEKDYDTLKRQFDALKADSEELLSRNKKLQAEILTLKNREPTELNLNKETEGSSSNRSENSSDIKADISKTPATERTLSAQATSLPLFPPSLRPNTVPQLFHNSSRPDHQIVKEETFYNMFCPIDDQAGFLPWLEQQNYH